MADPVRLLLVDDHPVVRRGLRGYLELEPDFVVVGEACDGEEALKAIVETRPDVVLLDLKMPGLDGQGVLDRLRGAEEGDGDGPAVLVLTSATDAERVPAAISAGAAGFVYKDIDPDALASAIRTVHAGQLLLSPIAMRGLMSGSTAPTAPSLTPRESQVLGLIAKGQTNRQIARALGVSEKTVKTHVTNLLRRIGAADRTQAALWAVRHGIG
ncbi:response regulator [Glycomyces harbinensis]|uniref:DNA-binding response regulator, NarL/FixJ family, contains REC and HTH domains n=1 Tax=Glycomyces harbinensis TaxID=58114 RepID=A0A1G7BC38_9ACTN|nr:response regulator transcription factor [Glycomyces harbinensis]SDE24477.1 DNA-binding response regulator, NarL/FixJ family, contains REC and HTH domains [Glycomyces harbinensis]